MQPKEESFGETRLGLLKMSGRQPVALKGFGVWLGGYFKPGF